MASPATFVLVHGGWHAGWCWDPLADRLRAAGQRVLAPDLPGHGANRLPATERPWEHYVPAIADLVAAQPEPVVLVGHSSGGMIAGAVARELPARVAAVVYLAAFLLPPGHSPRDVMGPNSGSVLTDAILFDPATGTTSIRPELARAAFYHDCTDETAAWAIARLQPEPAIPPGAGEGEPDPPGPAAPAPPRVYIETLQDRALPIAIQRRMVADIPCDAVFSLDASHSPFLSDPDGLARILLDIGARFARPTATP